MSKIWEVQLKGSFDNDYELSVIKSDNKFGKSSWGWGNENKIIIFSSGLGGNKLSKTTPEIKDFAISTANKLCDLLNSE